MDWRFALGALAILPAMASPVVAADVPIAGRSIRMTAPADASGRRIAFRSDVDPALAGPFPDPATGARLRVFAGNGSGQCRIDVSLDPAKWTAVGGDGPTRGWRYVDTSASTGGVKKILVKRASGGGKLLAKLKGSAIPCDLGEPQHLPLVVELTLGDVRYCSAFADPVLKNEPGRFKAKNAGPPATCLDRDVTMANLNILHGLFCPPGTGQCRLEERIDLLGEWIVERGCPDLVAIQEVSDTAGGSIPTLVADRLLGICPTPYALVFQQTNFLDDAIILSRHRVEDASVTTLLNGFRHVLHARIDHPVGFVDAFTTHLASGSDGATNPCGPSCPTECTAAGATTVRECQAEQTALLVEATHDVPGPAFLMGDMNAEPGEFEIDRFTSRGWIDTYLAAGNPECVPGTGLGCTGGRSEAQLEESGLNVDERIDYVFLVRSGLGSTCADVLDGPGDGDGDGTATRLFADAPNPFEPTCGVLPDPVCWASDHTGVEADLNCE